MMSAEKLAADAFKKGWLTCIESLEEATAEIAAELPPGQARDFSAALARAFTKFRETMEPKIDAIISEHMA